MHLKVLEVSNMGKMERDFEVVEFDGLRAIKCPPAEHQQIIADVFMSRIIYGDRWYDYAIAAPRFTQEYPTPKEFADDSLEYILSLA